MVGRVFSLAVLCGAMLPAQTSKPMPNNQGKLMHATGTFEVQVKPVEPSDIAKAADTGRMTIDKTWTGSITGTSKGEMLTGITKENASMAYVAMERFSGSVDGHTGTLLFSHTAAMRNNQPRPQDLNVTVVPGSGTGALEGIEGRLAIEIVGGVHRYDFAYTLPEKQ